MTTVFVVVANYNDDPHPHVEEVYDNEEAANDHKKRLANGAKAIAWDVIEKDIKSLGPLDYKCKYCGNEWKGHRLVEEKSCPQCNSRKLK